MTFDLPQYPTYKDSGVPWLGKVPAHWQLRRTKTLLRERSEKGHANEPLLAATQTKGVVRKEQYDNRTVLALKDLHLLKLVREGDFVISLRSFQGGIEYARDQGIISPAYTVLYVVTDTTVHGYLAVLFKSSPYIDNLRLYVTGIRQGQNLDYDKLSRSVLPLPPTDEQRRIVRFLKYTDRRILRYIATKQKLINLLEEQKQATIQQFVTHGLDPDVRLKPSGIGWLGKIPEHWEVRRLKTVVKQVTSGSRGWSDFAADYGALFVRIGNLTRASIALDLSDAVRLDLPPEALSEAKRTRVEPQDLLVSITAFIGSVAVAPPDIEEAYVSQHVACCKVKANVANTRWLAYLLLSPVGQAHGQLRMYGGTKQGLSLDDVKEYIVLLPPRTEQDPIVKALDEELALLNEAADRIHREMTFVREYRIRLIADVVTGKLDVREAAAHIPEVSGDVEAGDDLGVNESERFEENELEDINEVPA